MTNKGLTPKQKLNGLQFSINSWRAAAPYATLTHMRLYSGARLRRHGWESQDVECVFCLGQKTVQITRRRPPTWKHHLPPMPSSMFVPRSTLGGHNFSYAMLTTRAGPRMAQSWAQSASYLLGHWLPLRSLAGAIFPLARASRPKAQRVHSACSYTCRCRRRLETDETDEPDEPDETDETDEPGAPLPPE